MTRLELLGVVAHAGLVDPLDLAGHGVEAERPEWTFEEPRGLKAAIGPSTTDQQINRSTGRIASINQHPIRMDTK